MSEPIYEYTRGIGWQPCYGPLKVTHVILDYNGRPIRVTVTDRPPGPGERGWDIFGDDYWVVSRAELDLHKKRQWVLTEEIVNQLYCFIYGRSWPASDQHENIEECFYVTVEVEKL
jgi:hypothetical protein